MFKLIEFPEVQKYQNLDGFEDNSIAVTNENYPDGSVLIDINWLYKNNDLKAIQLIEESLADLPIPKRYLHTIETEWQQAIPFEGGMSTMEAIKQIIYNNLK